MRSSSRSQPHFQQENACQPAGTHHNRTPRIEAGVSLAFTSDVLVASSATEAVVRRIVVATIGPE
jgi:hypothetical protein